ncbi:MAG: 16S rRNA (guanine(966)-N(2))-methyltransferase RsmD [Alphaproteobacteria bacterium]|nr:16S rRNA (guanine(966)-N(2))-methyltransferase RsmD [Alphaproteobacteria bacterium]
MRIVGGKHRGRALLAPEGQAVRPTASRAREALFNILAHAPWAPEGGLPQGARVLDAFAGSGALGLEALSRGAVHATFLESDAGMVKLIGQNLAKLGEAAAGRAIRADATRPPRASAPCALWLLDPPYRSGLGVAALSALAEAGWGQPGTIAVLEIALNEDAAPPSGFEALDERRYGAAKLVLLRQTG